MCLTDPIGPIVNTEVKSLSSRRAVLWGRDDLLVQAVGSFLKNMEWDVIQVSNDGDVEKLICEVKRVNPQVVILSQDRASDSALPLRMIDEQPCLKVVTLGLDSNLVQVYSKQNVILQKPSDLLSLIETEHLSTCISGKEDRSKR